jgi:hypothetical protein
MCRPGRLLYLKQCGLNKQHRHRGPLSSSCSPRSALPKLCPCVAPAPAVDFTKFYATFFHSAQLTFFCTLFYYLTGNLQPPKVPLPLSVQRPGAYSFEPFPRLFPWTRARLAKRIFFPSRYSPEYYYTVGFAARNWVHCFTIWICSDTVASQFSVEPSGRSSSSVGHRSRSQDSWASSISASWSEWRFLRFDRSPTSLDLEWERERGFGTPTVPVWQLCISRKNLTINLINKI